LVLLGACGGGGGGSGPIDEETATEACTDSCEHQVECFPATDLDMCTTDCVDGLVGWAREDVVLDLVECQTALECGATNTCFEDVCVPTSAHETFEARCREEIVVCGEDPAGCEVTPGPNDEGIFCAIAPSIMNELTACMDEPDCAAIEACFQGVLTEHGINF
jgi:hypothetical protein